MNPISGTGASLIGRRRDRDDVQEGKSADGGTIRCTFSQITTDSFRWLGERLEADETTWRTQVEFQGKLKGPGRERD